MVKVRFLLATILLAQPLLANSHGLMPSRLEAPSGSKLVAFKFTAVNNYKEWDQYAVQCFKNDLNHPYECKAYPQTFNVASKKTRTFKAQIAPDEDGVYLVCTIQTREAQLVTRVCARFGVGVSPSIVTDGNRVGKSTVNTRIPPRTRQD